MQTFQVSIENGEVEIRIVDNDSPSAVRLFLSNRPDTGTHLIIRAKSEYAVRSTLCRYGL